MKRLDIKLEKEKLCYITKQLVHSVSFNIMISQPVLGLTNPGVNLKMHRLYNIRLDVVTSYGAIINDKSY